MVDFVKLAIPRDKRQGLEGNSMLNFILQVSEKTGEILNRKVAEYKGLKFIIWNSGYIELQGSLHKYYNQGKHNYNDFTLLQLQEVIKDLSVSFNIPFGRLAVKNIEFGINLQPLYKSTMVLNNCLLAGATRIKDISLSATRYNYKQATKQRLWLKFYDKKKHYQKEYNLTNEILRYELKYKKMIDLKEVGFYCLDELEKPSVLNGINTLLIKYWDSVLLFDKTIKTQELTKYVKDVKQNQWGNPNYWLELTPKKREKQRLLYSNIVNNHSDNIHLHIRNLINEKWNTLTRKGGIINQHFINIKGV